MKQFNLIFLVLIAIAMGSCSNDEVELSCHNLKEMDIIRSAGTAQQVENAFLKSAPAISQEIEFISSYLDAVLTKLSKEEAVSYTNTIYVEIDSKTNVNKFRLKDMVAVALASVNLWKPSNY